METLTTFFTDCYHWTPEQSAAMAAWMAQEQHGPDLERKQAIALDFQIWLARRDRPAITQPTPTDWEQLRASFR